MATLPDGMTIEFARHNKTDALYYHVTFTRDYIVRQALVMLDERITRAEIALPICKHTKRKHRLNKLLMMMREVRERFNNELMELEGDT